MTGAVTVVWFLGRKTKKSPPPGSTDCVDLEKPDSRVEAQRALRESAERKSAIQSQRGAVTRVAQSLAEIRKNNHFAESIRAAMGGEQ